MSRAVDRLLREYHPTLRPSLEEAAAESLVALGAREPMTNSGQPRPAGDTNSAPSYSNTRTTPHRERGALFPPFHHRANMSSFAEAETNPQSGNSARRSVSQR